MRVTTLKLAVAAIVSSAACNPGESEVATTRADDDDAAQKADDLQACHDAAEELFDMGCPAGFGPRVRIGGEPFSATVIEDVGIPICGGIGYWIDADAIVDPEWVGTNITQNSHCVAGCFGSYCQGHTDVCLAGWASGGLCTSYCSHDIDENGCRESVLACNGLEPEEVDPEDEGCGLAMGEDEGG